MYSFVHTPNNVWLQPINYCRLSDYTYLCLLVIDEIYLGKFRRFTFCGNNAANEMVNLTLCSKDELKPDIDTSLYPKMVI